MSAAIALVTTHALITPHVTDLAQAKRLGARENRRAEPNVNEFAWSANHPSYGRIVCALADHARAADGR